MTHSPVGPGETWPMVSASPNCRSVAQPFGSRSACRDGRLPVPPVENKEAFRKSQKYRGQFIAPPPAPGAGPNSRPRLPRPRRTE